MQYLLDYIIFSFTLYFVMIIHFAIAHNSVMFVDQRKLNPLSLFVVMFLSPLTYTLGSIEANKSYKYLQQSHKSHTSYKNKAGV